jgi:putative ABC transport system permease protein
LSHLQMLALRALRARPLRTMLSAFGVILGVAGLMAIGTTNATTLTAVTQLFRDTSGRADLVVTTVDQSKPSLPAFVAERARTVPGVVAVVPSVQAQSFLVDKQGSEGIGLSIFGASMGGVALSGIEPGQDQLVRTYKLTAGRFLSADLNAYELVLVDSYAEDNDLRLGADVAIWTPGGVQRLRLVGLIAKEGPARANNGAFGVLPIHAAQKIFDRQERPDQLDIVAAADYESPQALEGLRGSLQARLGGDVTVTFPAEQGKRTAQMLSSYQIGLNLLGGMALFVGAFLIYNAFSMSVVERTREIGFQRTLGMTRGQVFRQVLVEAALLGGFGALLGIGLGLAMAFGLTGLMGLVMNQDLGTPQVPLDGLVLSAVLGIGVTTVGASLPAWQAGRISPLAALRVRGSQKDGWLVRRGWAPGLGMLSLASAVLVFNPFAYDVQYRLGNMAVFVIFLGGALLVPTAIMVWERLARPAMRLIYGVAGGLGSGNIRRAKWRTTLTVAALMVGASMIVVTRGMSDMFKYDLRNWVEGYLGGDILVTSSVPMSTELGHRLESVPGVAAAAPIHYFSVRYPRPSGDENLMYMAIEPAVHGNVAKFMFSGGQQDQAAVLARLAAGDAVVISTVVAEKYDLKVGDSLRLKTARGPHDFAVAGIVVDYYNQGLTVEGSWSDMRRYFGLREASIYLLKVAPGQAVEQVRRLVEDTYGKKEHLTIEANASLIGRIMSQQTQVSALFDVLAVISLLIASLGVVNTLMMNVVERTQEIGLLRSVGMTKGQIVLMVLSEAGVMGLSGGILGVAFGVALAWIFVASMTAMSGYHLEFAVPVEGALMGLVVAWVVSQLAAILPARRAAGIRILEAIHYE